MQPEVYDAWYDTPRGRWIGEAEFALLSRLLDAPVGSSLLDVGCGTGWFTRRFAGSGLQVTGLDPGAAWLAYARGRAPDLDWIEGDARRLPFADKQFDQVVSVTALRFVDGWQGALREMARVARRRIVVGLLNRHSLLWWEKGRSGGKGAYLGAHWHTSAEIRAAMAALPLSTSPHGHLPALGQPPRPRPRTHPAGPVPRRRLSGRFGRCPTLTLG